MSRSFGVVDYKVQEAEYFLLQVLEARHKFDFRGVQFCTSAFVSASRSVTFAMQASLKGVPDFDSWYAARQARLRNDPLSRFFHDFRTVTNHIGVNLVGAASSGESGIRYFFRPCPELPRVSALDVATACRTYFVSVLELVYDCYLHLAHLVNGQHYFTEDNFQKLGKTVEDAEQELGFPRGWTGLGAVGSKTWRWKMLRSQADGCLIEELFERWLRKTLPHPDRL